MTEPVASSNMKPCQSAGALKSGSQTAGDPVISTGTTSPGRRLNPDQVDSEKALERAKALARAERDKIDL
jgi:hypothetical protein